MRLSSLTQHRVPQSKVAAQYALLYPTEAANSDSGGESDHRLPSHPVDHIRKSPSPRPSSAKQPNASKQSDGRRKPPAKEKMPPHAKLLVGRGEAAEILSISVRSVDYLLANRQLTFRRIGSRILIPVTDLQKFARMDHPARVAS
jgi:excisionase family DNA binding protein